MKIALKGVAALLATISLASANPSAPLLEIDITNPAAVTIKALENDSSANASILYGEGIDLEDFFKDYSSYHRIGMSGDLNPDYPGHFDTFGL